MANPNRSPMKGFIKELAKAEKPAAKDKSFKYEKRIVPASLDSMNTPRRLTEHKALAPAKSNIVKETAQHVKNRGTK